MINFILGLFAGLSIGSITGVGLMCLLQVAKGEEE